MTIPRGHVLAIRVVPHHLKRATPEDEGIIGHAWKRSGKEVVEEKVSKTNLPYWSTPDPNPLRNVRVLGPMLEASQNPFGVS